MSKTLVITLVAIAVAVGLWIALMSSTSDPNTITMLNVSYDPTRELWRDLNRAFKTVYEEQTGKTLVIEQSHGGSGSQARAVIDGQPADVVTLAMWGDIDAIRKNKLIADGWDRRLPQKSQPYQPYHSTIVFVVRTGNPKNISDWQDLTRPDIGVITPNPKTSGNGQLSFLGAWGAVKKKGGSDQEAEDFVKALYKNVKVLDTGARGATVTFAQRKIGDVHLTWENEAHLEVIEAKGALEIIYPPSSIKAEPYVAVVDANVDRHGTRAAAEAYLQFLYTDEGQDIIAKHYYRPGKAAFVAKHAERFRKINLFEVSSFVRDWAEAKERFFTDGGVFDRIYGGSK